MTMKKKAVHNEAGDAPEQTLTAEQQEELADALDLSKLLEALRKSPVLKMIVQQLIDTFFNPQPVFAAAHDGHDGHDHKAQLQAVLRMQLCAAHCLAHQIECCEEGHDHE